MTTLPARRSCSVPTIKRVVRNTAKIINLLLMIDALKSTKDCYLRQPITHRSTVDLPFDPINVAWSDRIGGWIQS
jgi:hypothetical protein